MLKVTTQSIKISTKGFTDIIDITPNLRNVLKEGNYLEGQMLVFIPGSTAALTTVEFEPGLEKDLKEMFEEWIPMDKRYHHNEAWHDGNGYAHVRSSMLKPSITIPFSDSELRLGTWQQVVFIDFDNRKRNRNLIVQLMGEVQK